MSLNSSITLSSGISPHLIRRYWLGRFSFKSDLHLTSLNSDIQQRAGINDLNAAINKVGAIHAGGIPQRDHSYAAGSWRPCRIERVHRSTIRRTASALRSIDKCSIARKVYDTSYSPLHIHAPWVSFLKSSVRVRCGCLISFFTAYPDMPSISPPYLITLWLILLWTHGAAEPLRLITVGDSITRGVRPDVKPEETFAALVQKTLIEKGIPTELTNAGIGGDTVDAVKRLHSDVIARKPHFVTVMYGTNDSYVSKGETMSRNTPTEYESTMRVMLTALKQAGIQPILMTSPPWAEGAPLDGQGQHPNIRLLPYIEICRRLALEIQVPVVDHFALWTAASEKGVKLKDWTSDYCHPNQRGHREMASHLLRTMLPLVQEYQHTPLSKRKAK